MERKVTLVHEHADKSGNVVTTTGNLKNVNLTETLSVAKTPGYVQIDKIYPSRMTPLSIPLERIRSITFHT